ncbi:hypothetical protein ACWDZ8_08385 [Streptomyces sp. NPDC003233]
MTTTLAAIVDGVCRRWQVEEDFQPAKGVYGSPLPSWPSPAPASRRPTLSASSSPAAAAHSSGS